MVVVEQGVVSNRGITLDRPLDLPEGSKVIVRIETALLPESESPEPQSIQEAFPFIGQWADRTDIPASAELVTQERVKWQQRPYRQD